MVVHTESKSQGDLFLKEAGKIANLVIVES